MKNINSLAKSVEVDHLTNISDVATPVPGKFLVRSASGAGYEWAYPTTQVKRSILDFADTARQAIKADLQQDGPITDDDYWSLTLDDKTYTSSVIGDVSDDFALSDGSTPDSELWGFWSDFNGSVNDPTKSSIKIVSERVKFETLNSDAIFGFCELRSQTRFIGGYDIKFTLFNLTTDLPNGWFAFSVAAPTDIDNENITLVYSTTSGTPCISLYGGFNHAANSIAANHSIATLVPLGGHSTAAFQFKYNGNLLEVNYSFDDWATKTNLSTITLSSYIDTTLEYAAYFWLHAGNTPIQGKAIYLDNFIYEEYGLGYARNPNRSLLTLEDVADNLRLKISKDFETSVLSPTSFSITNPVYGIFTYSYTANGSDSILLSVLQPGHVLSDSDVWGLLINGDIVQVLGTAVTTIDDVTSYFALHINDIDGVAASKLSSTTIQVISEIPGLDYAIEPRTSSPGMITITSSSDTLQQAFTDLVDTPESYVGYPNCVPIVKPTLDGIVLVPFTFKSLKDTPDTLEAGKILKVNDDGSAIVLADSEGGVVTITEEYRAANVLEDGVLYLISDTKALYVGDGVTVGGVSASSPGTLEDLTDVPTPIAASFLRRNADDTAFEWVNLTGVIIAETLDPITTLSSFDIGVTLHTNLSTDFPGPGGIAVTHKANSIAGAQYQYPSDSSGPFYRSTNDTGEWLAWIDLGSGGLPSLTNNANKFLAVNADEDALEWVSVQLDDGTYGTYTE